MQKGDILFFKPRSIKSKFIAWMDGSPFAHVGLYWTEIDGVHLFIDANWDGVKVRVLKEEWCNYVVVKHANKPKKDVEDIARVLYDNYGKMYDYTHLFHIFLYKLTRGRYTPPQTNPEKFICSELVNYVYGFFPYGTATPANLFQFLISQ